MWCVVRCVCTVVCVVVFGGYSGVGVRIIFMLFWCVYLGFCCLFNVGLRGWVVLLTRCVP